MSITCSGLPTNAELRATKSSIDSNTTGSPARRWNARRVSKAIRYTEDFTPRTRFEKDPDTKLIVMIGEIGGDAEERAADYIKANVSKPVVGYVAGFTAPEGKTMGHAGAIVSGSSGTAAAKKEALEAAGVKVGKTPSETAELAREILKSL